MRLINARTLGLKEFHGDAIPHYAILSHTWGDGEVSFQDWQNQSSAFQKAGFFKIKKACQQARKDHLEWLWVDTCCIDKTSSAELSEAINSMFAWYAGSVVCYAFLSDVKGRPGEKGVRQSLFQASRWFTRGWTLQELVAPKAVLFFTADWTKFATRDGSDAALITRATGITPELLLEARERPENVCIGTKMSWLARRQTTRVEDMAYCMLGLFDINMPLLYGEGPRAFARLQQEIIKMSNDHSIFCWRRDSTVPKDWGSLLAPFPSVFTGLPSFSKNNYMNAYEDAEFRNTSMYAMTNAGLSISLPLISTGDKFFAVLNLTYEGGVRSPCIPLLLASDGVQTTVGTTGQKRALRVTRAAWPATPIPFYVNPFCHSLTPCLVSSRGAQQGRHDLRGKFNSAVTLLLGHHRDVFNLSGCKAAPEGGYNRHTGEVELRLGFKHHVFLPDGGDATVQMTILEIPMPQSIPGASFSTFCVGLAALLPADQEKEPRAFCQIFDMELEAATNQRQFWIDQMTSLRSCRRSHSSIDLNLTITIGPRLDNSSSGIYLLFLTQGAFHVDYEDTAKLESYPHV